MWTFLKGKRWDSVRSGEDRRWCSDRRIVSMEVGTDRREGTDRRSHLDRRYQGDSDQ